MFGQGIGQRTALVHLLADAGQDHLQLAVIGLLGQGPERLGQGNPGVNQGCELTGEDRHILRPHALEPALDVDFAPQTLAPAGRRGHRLLGLLARNHLVQFGDEDAFLAQALAQRLGAVGLAVAGGRLAAGVDAFPCIKWHVGVSLASSRLRW